MVSLKTFQRSLFPKPVPWLGLFFATSYSKTALDNIQVQFLWIFLLIVILGGLRMDFHHTNVLFKNKKVETNLNSNIQNF